MVAYRHRLSAYHSKHCRRAFQWYQHRWPWTTLNPQNRGSSNFFAISGDAYMWIFAEVTGDKPRQPAYEIRLMLSRVRWALAQTSCSHNCINCWSICSIISPIFSAANLHLSYHWRRSQQTTPHPQACRYTTLWNTVTVRTSMSYSVTFSILKLHNRMW